MMQFTRVAWRLGVCLALAVGLSAHAAVEANQASPHDLMTIKGIGPATSQRIVEARQSRLFSDWDDFIERVKGVGPKRAQTMSSNGLTVNGRPMHSTDQDAAQAPLWQPPTPRPLLKP